MHSAALPRSTDNQSEKRHRGLGGSRPSIHPQHHARAQKLSDSRAPGAPHWRGWCRLVPVQKESWETCSVSSHQAMGLSWEEDGSTEQVRNL